MVELDRPGDAVVTTSDLQPDNARIPKVEISSASLGTN